MVGKELRPGLWRWTAKYPEWKQEVASVAVASKDDFVLIDPLLTGDRWERLEADLGGRTLHVLLTIHWHARSAAEVATRFPGTRVWAHSRNRAAIAGERRSATSSAPAIRCRAAWSPWRPVPAARFYSGSPARGR